MQLAANLASYFDKLSGILGILTNRILVMAVTAQLASMVVKGIIKSIKNGKFSFKQMSDYGGMPSSHTTFIISCLIGIGLEDGYGWRSPLFGFAGVMAFIILVDAVKFRGNVDKLNDNLAEVIDKTENLRGTLKNPHHIAHQLNEVIAGIIFAFIYTFVFYLFFYNLF